MNNLTAALKAAVSACCLLFLMHQSSSAFSLRASHTQLTFAADESLTLKCSHFPEEVFMETELVAVREMRLVKRVGNRGWQTMTQIWANDQEITAQVGLDVIGQVGTNVTDSYLNAVWYHTSPDVLGLYRCDVVGTDRNNDLVLEKTNVVAVFDNNVTTHDMLMASDKQLEELHLEFNKYKGHTEEQFRSLRNAMEEVRDTVGNQVNKAKAMTGSISDLGQQLRTEMQESFKELQTKFTSKATTCGCPAGSGNGNGDESGSAEETIKVEEITTTSTTTVSYEPEKDDERRNDTWPEQIFGLPMPESGCPETPGSPTWTSGHKGYHTESVDENRDNVSIPNHLAGPVARVDSQGNHFMYLHFCIKGGVPETSPARINGSDGQSGEELDPVQWPAGSYCINRAKGRCPRGFRSGYLDIDEEDTAHTRKLKTPLPDMLFFCCRKDGPATRRVRLPTQKPFFLYRFGGKCQAVRDMQVAGESVTLDTENVNNSDGYENNFHPDGHVEDVHMELCYYSQ